MRKAPWCLVTALLLTLGISSTASAKELFSDFYFFGDSLSDMGNNAVTDGGAPITNPGGSTWTNYFAGKFSNGGSSTASNNGGNNYAYAGAETGIGTNTGTTNTGTLGQVQRYLQGHTIERNALYSVWAGANDIENGLVAERTAAQIIAQGVGNTSAIVQALHNAGAKYIMVFNLPDISQTPLAAELVGVLGPEVLAKLSELSNAYDHVLASTLNAQGFDVIQLNVLSLLNDVIANPARFGFTNVTGECSQTSGGCASTFLFWDDQHPTVGGHSMIADYAYSVVVGPTRAAILAEAPFSVMDAQNANIENQIYNIRTRMAKLAVGQTSIFGSTSYTPYKQNNQGTAGPGFDARSADLTVGIIHRINNHLIAGAGIAHSFGHVDFGQHTGSFDMRENMASLFSSYQANAFYADGIVNYGVIDFSSVTRNIPIGISQNAASGKTDGSQVGADLIVGYNIIDKNKLQTGPLANIDYQHIRVNTYAESGTISGIAEQFDNQTNDSLTTGLGWQLAYTFDANNTPIMPFAQLTYNHQWINSERDVGAGLVSLPGSHFTIPVSGPGNNFALASTGVSINFAKRVNLSFGYATTLFMSGGRSQNVNANIQIAL